MNKIIKNMDVLPKHKQYPDEMEMHQDVSVYESGGQLPTPGSFGVLQEYILKAEVGVEFRCNPAQLKDGAERARRMAARRLYRDQREYTEEVIYAVQNGDKTSALKMLHRLLDSMDIG